MKPIHPALALYEKLFNEVANGADETIGSSLHNPNAFVETSPFMARLTKEGIDHPEDFVTYAAWLDEIGLPEFAHKLILAHHRKHGTRPDPASRGAWRLRCHIKRHGIGA